MVKKKEQVAEPAQRMDEETLFWAYYNMGARRSLRGLAKQTGETFTRIKHISTKNKWLERVSQIDKEDQETLQEVNRLANHAELLQFRVASNIVNGESKDADKLKALTFIADLLKRAQDIKKRKRIVIEFTNMADLERVVDKIRRDRCEQIKLREMRKKEEQQEKADLNEG